MQLVELQFKLDKTILTQRVLSIRVGVSDVNLAMDRVAGKLKPKVEVAGFRKGKAPLALIRKEYRSRIAAEAFDDLQHAAFQQISKQFEETDRPFTPPEVLDRENVKLRYGKPLEFSIKYLVDPTGIGNRPEAPADQPGPSQSNQANGRRQLPIGVAAGPSLPTAPQSPKLPATPKLPSLPKLGT